MKLLYYEGKYEKVFSIDTSLIKKSTDKDNYHYQGASYWILLNLLKDIPSKYKEGEFIDYGSGKGRALFCAEQCGFTKLIGVEMDKELDELAKKNYKNYSKKNSNSTFTFVNKNAIEYQIPSTAKTFYFFNPFSDMIMRKVALNIRHHVQEQKQDVLIIYLNPKHTDVWEDLGFNTIKTIKTRWYLEAKLFQLSFLNN